MGVATYYFTYIAMNDGLLSAYMLVTNIFCVIGAYLSKALSNRFTTRTTTIGVMAIQAILLIVSYLFYNNVTLVIVLMSVAMFGYGITYACTPALYGDTIIYSEWKTGKNAGRMDQRTSECTFESFYYDQRNYYFRMSRYGKFSVRILIRQRLRKG